MGTLSRSKLLAVDAVLLVLCWGLTALSGWGISELVKKVQRDKPVADPDYEAVRLSSQNQGMFLEDGVTYQFLYEDKVYTKRIDTDVRTADFNIYKRKRDGHMEPTKPTLIKKEIVWEIVSSVFFLGLLALLLVCVSVLMALKLYCDYKGIRLPPFFSL